MTITGRTTEKRARDASARWDSHAGNGFRTRSYPQHIYVRKETPAPDAETAVLSGRPGYSERDMKVLRRDDEVRIILTGWYDADITLNERQAHFLRDTLHAWFPNE